jgi:hypothetical protein
LITHEAVTRARLALAQPEPVGPTDEELNDTYWKAWHEHLDRTNSVLHAAGLRAVLARYCRPALTPVPVSERFEFSVFDSEYEEQAGGTAPTYSQALSEGLHYLSVYSQDGPHSLELRRVQVLPFHALPLPEGGAA